MTSIKLTVSGASASAEVDGLLTSGMVGIPVAITYDSAWDGLTKALVCRGGSVVRTILNVGGTATIAHECMVPNQTLFIGIEGRNADGTLVIPTVWARCGLICSGANADADHSTDPTLPVWAQIQAMIGNLDDLDTTAKNNLVVAVNEALTKGGGGGGSTVELDTTLTQSGQAADAKAAGDAIRSLSEEIANLQTSGLTTAQVNALDGMFKVCAFTKDNVSAEYTAFKTAFGITDSGGETEVTLTSISATYNGGDVAVGTALSDLTGIVVTATYSDGSTATVTGYTLSGEIVEGDNTISVTYNGKTATFTVIGTVTDARVEHIVSGQTFPVTLTWGPVAFDVTPALATYGNGESTITYYDVELDVESISSKNAYVMVTIGAGAFVKNARDYAGQTGTLKMTGEIWHPSMSDASQINISCNKGTETDGQTAVITGVRIYER